MRVAIIGRGLAGRSFHAPLITATPGLTVDWIGRDVEQVWERRPDLVVVATPNDSHAPLARAAIERGIPVVVDKPLAVSSEQAQELVEFAAGRGVLLTVFQNRRWDTDFLSLRALVKQGALGEVVRFESRFERWRPEADEAKWREAVAPELGGGQLIDLGAHLVDQALLLLGPAARVYAEVAARRGSAGDDDAFVAITHRDGGISHLHASAVTPSPGPRMRVQGTRGAYLVNGLDPQEDALREGRRPDTDPRWGVPAEWELGRFVTGEQSVPVPPVPGAWGDFYAGVEQAVREGGPPPVDPWDAVQALRVIEAARVSAAEHRVVELAR